MLTSLLMIALATVPRVEAPVAVVAEYKGEIHLEGCPALKVGSPVPAHRWIHLSQGAKLAMIHLVHGENWQFEGPCRFRLSQAGPRPSTIRFSRKPVKALRGALKLNPEAIAQASLVLRTRDAPADLAFHPSGPRVLDPRPTFTWTAPDDCSAFRFRLVDTMGTALLDIALQTPCARLPEGIHLADHMAYTWILDGFGPGGPVRTWTGRLELLDEHIRTALEESRPGRDASPAESVAFRLLLKQFKIQEDENRS